jgi:hypothetical protein
MLSDPTIVLQDHGCAPQQYKSLRSIDAESVHDFARQARALFWTSEPRGIGASPRQAAFADDHSQLAVAASM